MPFDAVVVVAMARLDVMLEVVGELNLERLLDNAALRVPEKARMMANTATSVANTLNLLVFPLLVD